MRYTREEAEAIVAKKYPPQKPKKGGKNGNKQGSVQVLPGAGKKGS